MRVVKSIKVDRYLMGREEIHVEYGMAPWRWPRSLRTLIAALLLSTLTSAMIVNDGEATWIEGVALIGLYGIFAAAFWWG